MTLPIDLVLLRHGQSEGNLARQRSKDGDNSVFIEEFKNRHTAQYRLTAKGREQAKRAGAWLRKEFGDRRVRFDRYFVSEYTRAKETAALLALPHAQ